ncbi:hypothetical protein ANCDUO_08348, partial [Ancylostoma duodenale]
GYFCLYAVSYFYGDLYIQRRPFTFNNFVERMWLATLLLALATFQTYLFSAVIRCSMYISNGEKPCTVTGKLKQFHTNYLCNTVIKLIKPDLSLHQLPLAQQHRILPTRDIVVDPTAVHPLECKESRGAPKKIQAPCDLLKLKTSDEGERAPSSAVVSESDLPRRTACGGQLAGEEVFNRQHDHSCVEPDTNICALNYAYNPTPDLLLFQYKGQYDENKPKKSPKQKGFHVQWSLQKSGIIDDDEASTTMKLRKYETEPTSDLHEPLIKLESVDETTELTPAKVGQQKRGQSESPRKDRTTNTQPAQKAVTPEVGRMSHGYNSFDQPTTSKASTSSMSKAPAPIASRSERHSSKDSHRRESSSTSPQRKLSDKSRELEHRLKRESEPNVGAVSK